MIGAILGDIIGSRFEGRKPPVSKAFSFFHDECIFTDDTVLSVAIADSILTGLSYEESLRKWYAKYPYAGYGSGFKEWAKNPLSEPYDSYGNGSAMRVSPVGWCCNSVEEVLETAKKTAMMSHNHEEGIKGAQAIALSVYLCTTGISKDGIKEEMEALGVDFSEANKVGFNTSCQVTVPQALNAFFESNSTEDAIRRAIMIGGDADTLACMAGAIGHAFYNDLTEEHIDGIFYRLTPEIAEVVKKFTVKYIDPEFSINISTSEDYLEKDLFRSLFTS